ncbi:hypothetical protein ACHAXR_000614, partial [Thalassiosira sp. AJA248-18]
TESPLGITLTASLEELQLEIGVQGCPLTYDYEIWGHLAEHSWIKALWEKVYRLDIDLRLDYADLQPPRETDRCLMEVCVEAGLRGKQLLQVNRARICQEVVFISDIASANGRYIEHHLLRDWKLSHEFNLGMHRSSHKFGVVFLTDKDWDEWQLALSSLTIGPYSLAKPLGKWKANSPRIWSNTDHGPNHFVFHASDGPERATGAPATVSVVDDDTYKVAHGGGQFYCEEDPVEPTFRETLGEWGGDWMWEGLDLPDDMGWIADALSANTLIGVTDGSYDRKKGPNISGAGWILYCRATN